MTINSDTSSRIEILRFPLIVGVVFIHNFSTTIFMTYGPVGVTHSRVWSDFIRFFVSQGVARVSVPLFFMISGYLFFSGKWSRERYVSKLKSTDTLSSDPIRLLESCDAVDLYGWAEYSPNKRVFSRRDMAAD